MSRRYTLAELAEYLEADFAGDPDCPLSALATLQNAQSGDVSFIANPAYKKFLATTRASAVIISPELASEFSGNCLLTATPYQAYARLTALFARGSTPLGGRHESAIIGAGCTLAPDAIVGPNAVLGNDVVVGAGAEIGPGVSIGDGCVIGAGCRLAAGVVLYHDVRLGERCILHSGSVLGADGFGFAPQKDGGWLKIHQLGGVVLGNDVEVGAGTTIDRGALDDTVIGDGVKIDNQVQIAHNVRIGKNSAIAGQAGIAGSTTLGQNCTIAGGVGIIGHLTIADNVHVTAMSLVTRSIDRAGSYSSGTPLSTSREWRRNAVRFRQLDGLFNRLKRAERRDK